MNAHKKPRSKVLIESHQGPYSRRKLLRRLAALRSPISRNSVADWPQKGLVETGWRGHFQRVFNIGSRNGRGDADSVILRRISGGFLTNHPRMALMAEESCSKPVELGPAASRDGPESTHQSEFDTNSARARSIEPIRDFEGEGDDLDSAHRI